MSISLLSPSSTLTSPRDGLSCSRIRNRCNASSLSKLECRPRLVCLKNNYLRQSVGCHHKFFRSLLRPTFSDGRSRWLKLKRDFQSHGFNPLADASPRLRVHKAPVHRSNESNADHRSQIQKAPEAKEPRNLSSVLKKYLGGGTLALFAFLGGANLETPGSIIEAVSVLALIVTVHECGHFLAARLQNIIVTKFAIGFGPTVFKYKGDVVEYSLRAIPLGGYVAFPDDDPQSEYPPDDPNLLNNRPIYQRALVISAGVIANLIFAYAVLFTQVSTVGIVKQEFLPGVAVPEVMSDSVAYEAGIKKGDVILLADGEALPADESAVSILVDSIKFHVDSPVELVVFRDGETFSLSVVPDRAKDGSGRIGVQLAPNADLLRIRASDFFESLRLSNEEYGRLLGSVLFGLSQIVFNFENTADRVSGPIAIVAVGAEVARSDVSGLFQFAAIVNLNLAVVNSLPLPALDGGYFLLLVVEALRGGRKLPSGVVQGIMSSGLLLILAVGIILIVKDTLNLVVF